MDISSSLIFITDDFGYKRVLGLGWDKEDRVVSWAILASLWEAEELSLPNMRSLSQRQRTCVANSKSQTLGQCWATLANQLLQLLLDSEGRDWVCWMHCWFPVPNIMPGTKQVLNKPLWDERRNEWSLLLFLKSPYGNFYVEFYYILHLYRLQVTFGGCP